MASTRETRRDQARVCLPAVWPGTMVRSGGREPGQARGWCCSTRTFGWVGRRSVERRLPGGEGRGADVQQADRRETSLYPGSPRPTTTTTTTTTIHRSRSCGRAANQHGAAKACYTMLAFTSRQQQQGSGPASRAATTMGRGLNLCDKEPPERMRGKYRGVRSGWIKRQGRDSR